MSIEKANQGFLLSHIPRCIMGFEATIHTAPAFPLDGHASTADFGPDASEKIIASDQLLSSFAVACACGSQHHSIKGYSWQNPNFENLEVFLSPINLSCVSCAKESVVFDSDLHGYNAELGLGSRSVRAEGALSLFGCSQCDSCSFEVSTCFEFSDYVFEDEDFKGREQDFFGWFTLLGKCAACGAEHLVADFECA